MKLSRIYSINKFLFHGFILFDSDQLMTEQESVLHICLTSADLNKIDAHFRFHVILRNII